MIQMTPLMREEDWKGIRYFKPSEWGEWWRVSRSLIVSVDRWRGVLGRPVRVHNAYEPSGHTDGSLHYEGKAVDLHVEGLHVVDQFLAAERSGLFDGIGIYPFWINPGLHLDKRPETARWARNAAGLYVSIDWAFLRSLA